MAKATQTLKTGMTVLTGGNVPAYTLEYLSPSKKKKTGEFETIVIPYIEIGRAKNCNVRYREEDTTVSRKHAAIERRGSAYFLIHFSKTNPSLINGKPVTKEARLNNGDEIQLSMEGPKLRFNTTASGTANMGFTKKINLLIKQSTKQYRTAMQTLLVVLIVAVLTGGWFIYSQNVQLKEQDTQLKAMQEANEEIRQQRKKDSIRHLEKSEKNSKEIAALIQGNLELQKKTDELSNKPTVILPNPPIGGKEIYKLLKNDIYYLEVKEVYVTYPWGESEAIEMGWTGTAFMCEDGKLVTARHCIQGWRYSDDFTSNIVNICELNGGRVSVRFRVTSPKDWFEFEYKDVVLDDGSDVSSSLDVENADGTTTNYNLKFALDFKSDWAYFQTGRTSENLTYDTDLSYNLDAGEKLYVLGFSLGKGGPKSGEVNPIYSESSVAHSGISDEGVILISSRSFESGNSGGPVFVQRNNKTKCIGIVSYGALHQTTGAMTSIGGIVPIGKIQ